MRKTTRATPSTEGVPPRHVSTQAPAAILERGQEVAAAPSCEVVTNCVNAVLLRTRLLPLRPARLLMSATPCPRPSMSTSTGTPNGTPTINRSLLCRVPLPGDDPCNTVNLGGRPTKACQHPGAGCDLGNGPGSDRCRFVRGGDELCECGPTVSHPPAMPKDELDAFTATLLKSSYFGGLSEYGVGAPSFGGDSCRTGNAHKRRRREVDFYAPIDPSIIGFLQCELDHDRGIPRGPQVVYNIILPTGSLESDFFGAHTLCDGGATAWHFHQSPYSTEAQIVLGVGLLSRGTGSGSDALATFLAALALVEGGGPVFTIVSADPKCGNFVQNLVHEMVEAASDPFPGVRRYPEP